MYRLVHIEPDPAVHRAVARALMNGPYPFTIHRADDLAAAAASPDHPDPPVADVVLLGAAPGAATLAVLRDCRSRFPEAATIVLTGEADMAFAQAALRAGAEDVVLAGERAFAVLARILLYAIERVGARRRHERLKLEVAGLEALLDAIVANPFESILQTDAKGLIERASPLAMELLGLDAAAPGRVHLAERLRHEERPRLAALWRRRSPAGRPGPAIFAEPAIFNIQVAGESRLLELEPVPLATGLAEPPRLFRLAELAAGFAAAPEPAPPPARPPAPAATPSAGIELAGTPCAAAAAKPLARLAELVPGIAWRSVATTGATGARYRLLATDRRSAEALAGLARRAGDDADLSLALDRLQIAAWLDLAASGEASTRNRWIFEVSYPTFKSRRHFERLEAELADRAGELGCTFLFLLRRVPHGVHVPTLARLTRALAAEQPRPGLELADLDTDYRLLGFEHLGLVAIDLADLKRALAADARQLAALLRRVRNDGCLTLVRGVAGPFAEKLRQRLAIDLTVEL